MSRALKLGDTGDDVRALQRGLLALGYTGTGGLIADGVFGRLTGGALERFQADKRLGVDGVAGPLTLAALAKAVPAELPVATAEEHPYEFHTSGPDHHDDGMNAEITDGWYHRARRVDAHPGRIGRAITPCGVVVHTTDMMPGTLSGLVARWHGEAGSGAAAHFIIGRDPAQGVVQMISTLRNANHAGGPKHGNYRLTSGALVHPNLWTVGIEVHAGGRLKRNGTVWFHPDSVTRVDPADVFVDERGVGWHKITDYQFTELEMLLCAIRPTLDTMPRGTTIAPNGTYAENGVAPWAAVDGKPVICGHATLDPENKTDCGPELMAWLRACAVNP